ncbi:hypothetical protein EN817_23635 [Mesorhizobium sp. M3A.F.Ca.ET.174.01.1.1]|uniref:AAA family ATPase n=1 Tax=unclassified Mesorhizobium TaxID=325217 RepID=UPI001093CD69|nr:MULTISPECIES: AAA family ATPase [unclassified Mesorhizobium]TGS85091.1 hypothetical protein EN818_21720 [Mesorhizobium sp. M3A.F.Ca.ET.175.01.1.1]TGT23079.1 hypothetical protein EN817_23635 [Mesorhizobium sp. M3A.F.Ca.ET.174.01.1.1]
MTTAVTLQVTSFHDGPWGGGVLLGLGTDGGRETLRARIPGRVLPRRPVPGELWRVTGSLGAYPVRDPRTGSVEEVEHIDAAWAAPAMPRGAAIRRWIARNPAIPGVGEGYAERLWEAFGGRLYDLIRTRDVEALAEVLDRAKAAAIVDAFGLLLDEVTALQELDELGIEGATANAAVRLFGADAARRFRDNPYAMTLAEPWRKVDAAALASGLDPADRRRMLAAVDVAAAQAFRTTEGSFGGHTVVTRDALLRRVRPMLAPLPARTAADALEAAITAGVLREVSKERYQARGPDLMERELEKAIAGRLARSKPDVPVATLLAAIAEVEAETGVRFEAEQREAVFAALTSAVCVIDGGAGTGKSTIVRAVLHAHAKLGRGDVVQVALSGRAAKRLSEATGRPAMTVYRLQKDLELGKRSMRSGLVVVDEFSMVGTPDLWQLLTALPIDVDVIFVGDPAQLPPIRAGNPAQAMCASPAVPRVTLARIHRQAAATGIPEIADAIRRGALPELPPFDARHADRPGVFLASCLEDAVPQTVMDVLAAVAGLHAPGGDPVSKLHSTDVQVLAMARRGPAGAIGLSDAIESRWLSAQAAVHDWGLRIGSKILWVRNSYDRPTGTRDAAGQEQAIDLMNGALGVVRRATEAGAEVTFDNGLTAEIFAPDLADLVRGWAITVHKAQGSAFRTVVIPVVRSRLLDRAMLYTAVTRARERVVLVSDPLLCREAAERPPHSALRLQALDFDAARPD